jgi:hypothetical protein
MDDVERMYRHLVRTIRSTSPQLLTQPFQVADLYATILPVPSAPARSRARDEPGLRDGDARAASGARGYLVVEDRMREVLAPR